MRYIVAFPPIALGLLLAILGVATLHAPAPEPLVLHWRPATAAEDRQWQLDQLAAEMQWQRETAR
ncbi:hypothetical protein KBX71_07685 [Micromonospora sp. D93]|uniref:hypothetical protein n=1 Tax=Micromonospora sp. D93 TaxID=2824886 RepID=UPI001B3777E5|nr:hypothetical protein [Micromonospora sp. D93]MBQ1017750.1 hypothetical protein [Micromonospora sp. D93]